MAVGDCVAIVTGASSGIGLRTAAALYDKGYTVVLACRNERKTRQCIERDILRAAGASSPRLIYMHVDLEDLSTVRAFAKKFSSQFSNLHVTWRSVQTLACGQ